MNRLSTINTHTTCNIILEITLIVGNMKPLKGGNFSFESVFFRSAGCLSNTPLLWMLLLSSGNTLISSSLEWDVLNWPLNTVHGCQSSESIPCEMLQRTVIIFNSLLLIPDGLLRLRSRWTPITFYHFISSFNHYDYKLL